MHPYAGVLSAYGMGLADIGALRERTVELPLEPEQLAAVEATLDELAAEATAEVRAHVIREASGSWIQWCISLYIRCIHIASTPSDVFVHNPLR